MAAFLTDAWLADLGEAVHGVAVPEGMRLVVQQIVVDDDARETAYAIRIEDGRVAVAPGRAVDADVTFTQDRATATAIARGEVSAQVAFMAGRLRLDGDLLSAMEQTGHIVDLDHLFTATRATTTW
ncbi:MAG: SCP2 sterol-binding domain-containing protein [Acidimicrobiales bacterium]